MKYILLECCWYRTVDIGYVPSHGLMVVWAYPLLRCKSGSGNPEKEKAKSTKLLWTPKLVRHFIAEPRPLAMATRIRNLTSDRCPSLQKVLQTRACRGQGSGNQGSAAATAADEGEPQVVWVRLNGYYWVLLNIGLHQSSSHHHSYMVIRND